MLKHIWSLFAQSSSIWVAWVDSNWLKRRSLWNISIPKVCSWSWKKLLNLRETAKKFLNFKVGEGTSISLWFDLRHPAGRLLDTYGFRIVYDTGNSLDALLSSVIKDGKWSWPPARSDTLEEIQNRLFDVDIGDGDSPVWSSKNGVYSCADTWNCLRTKFPEVLGVMLSGFHWLFLGMLLFCGLFSMMPLLLRTGCVGGGLREIPFAGSAMVDKNP